VYVNTSLASPAPDKCI